MHVACAYPMRFSYTQDLLLDDSSLCLGIEMVEISKVEARVLSLDCRKKMQDMKTLTLRGVFIGFLLGLSDIKTPWAWVT